MATIKQITKQIETATKRIADFDRKIAMYHHRQGKHEWPIHLERIFIARIHPGCHRL